MKTITKRIKLLPLVLAFTYIFVVSKNDHIEPNTKLYIAGAMIIVSAIITGILLTKGEYQNNSKKNKIIIFSIAILITLLITIGTFVKQAV